MRGLKTLKTACATIQGFGVMQALRKSQASSFNLGPGVLAEAVRFISQQRELQAA
ncbi:hypothetical protein [Azospirillum himalayense]|uniref:Uncharacterized protein n=1 Tax=Azospirillum himalayense TaxID=654847 RepID=A0ABW0GFZ0_9PROT